MKITREHFEAAISDIKSHSKAFSYHNEDVVEEIDIQYDPVDAVYNVAAIVEVHGEKYHSYIDITRSGTIISPTCECYYCDTTSACAHIGAVILKINQLNPTSFPFRYVKGQNQKRLEASSYLELILKEQERVSMQRKLNVSHDFLEKMEERYNYKIDATIQNQIVSLEPNLEKTYDGFKLSYRIGAEKKYIIKSIFQFCEDVEQQAYRHYGKALSLIHQITAFDDFSKQQIAFLQRHCIRDSQYYAEFYRVGRDMFLSETIIDDFFDTYVDQTFDGNFECIDSDKRIHISLEKQGDYYALTAQFPDFICFGKKHLYCFENNDKKIICERIIGDEYGRCLALFEQLHHEKMILSLEQLDALKKYVLNEIDDYVDYEGEELDNSTIENLSLYGDVNEEGNIVFRLEIFDEFGRKKDAFTNNPFKQSFACDVVETTIKRYAESIDIEQHVAIFNANSSSTIDFIQDILPTLNQYCLIYVSEALKKIGTTRTYSIAVGVRMNGHLLEFDVDSLEIPRDELNDVLKAYRQKRKFHRLKNGELLTLDSHELNELDQFLHKNAISLQQLHNGHAEMENYRMFSINQQASASEYLLFDREASFMECLEDFDEKKTQSFVIPFAYDTILRDYQKEGIKWLSLIQAYGFNGILADDMGLGKTLQVIALLESQQALDKTSLVVCPSSLIYNWYDEIHKFSKKLKAQCIVGNQNTRFELITSSRNVDVCITSYDYLRRDIDHYQNIDFHYVILDEAQYIKNQKTKNAWSVKQLKSSHRLALTGTPIENSLAELWSIFDFLMPNYLFNYHYFQSHYENEIVRLGNAAVADELKMLVSPFILRRNKNEVLTELPDKIETTKIVSFNDEEKKLYFAHLSMINDQLQQMKPDDASNKFEILAMLTRLRQICCEPRLLFDNISQKSSKLMACIHLIENFHLNQQKVLVFSSFTTVLDLIAEECSVRGIKLHMLTGKTSKEERRRLVDAFQNDDSTVFLISLKAGGTGLNLTAAQGVIHYDPWWNLSAQNQATDRAYRIGQNNNVQVFKLIMKDSIEEKIQTLQLMKKDLADTFVEGNTGSLSSMSKEELMELFQL